METIRLAMVRYATVFEIHHVGMESDKGHARGDSICSKASLWDRSFQFRKGHAFYSGHEARSTGKDYAFSG